ncbi:MAG: polysaccharide deacetylase family protein, partial [Clostridia bacterium]
MKNKTISIITNCILVMLVITVGIISFSGAGYVTTFTSDKPIYKGDTSKKNVTLMINVYWGTEFIEPMLDCLSKHNITTTFFVGGTWVEKNQDIFLKIVNNGHEIGNHGYFHKSHDKLSYEQNITEISSCHKVVQTYSLKSMKLFAPPSGAFSNTTLKAAKDLGYTTIMWSRDTIDWRDKDRKLIFTRATKNITNGELILMHP